MQISGFDLHHKDCKSKKIHVQYQITNKRISFIGFRYIIVEINRI